MCRVDPKYMEAILIVIGLTGGIASGKSEVAGVLSSLGGALIDADRIAHEVLEESDVTKAIEDAFGPDVVTPEGTVDRKVLADVVFNQADQRKILEAIVHPRVRGRMLDRIEDHKAEGAPAVILDVPLLAEGGLDNVCDLVVFVDTPIDIRVRRAQETRGWDADEISRREAHQLPPEEKRDRASVVIENGGTRENTREQIETFWNEQVVPRIED